MAGEEKFKRIGEAVARVLGGEDQPAVLPIEAPIPIDAGVEPPKPEKKSFIAVTTEKLKSFAEKVSKGVPEAAKKIVHEGERPRDARVLSVVEELLDMDEAALADPAAMRPVGEKLIHIIQEAGSRSETGREAKKYLSRITTEHKSLADLRVQAQQLDASALSAVDRLFDDSGTDALAGTPIESSLRKYQQLLRYDEGELHDTHKVAGYIEDLKNEAYKQGYAEREVKKAIGRLSDVISETRAKQEQLQELQPYRGEPMIRWDEIKNQVGPEISHEDGLPVIRFRYLRESDVGMLKKGNEEEWFYSFMDNIYGLSRERAQPSLQDQGKWEEFEAFLQWKYGGDSERHLQAYRIDWSERGRHQHVINGLLYQPGDIKDRLRSLRLITGADLDYYYKNFEYSNNAATLYEQVVMDIMADRRARYTESIEWLQEKVNFEGKMIARDEFYMELRKRNRAEYRSDAGEKRIGKLTPEQQKLMMEIKTRLDLVGEGVMLWDSDVQSYTEVYLESQKMQQRYDALLSKQREGSLTPGESEELSSLPEKIDKKLASYKQTKENGESSRKELNELRGMSPVDIEVRKRLLVYLAQRGLPPPSEYKLRMAIWAARQASIGSGHIVSIGAFQAIEPGKIPDEVYLRHVPGLEELYKESHGKAVMRAPAFEDLQRFYNPELFSHRFGMLDEMGLRARQYLTLSHLKEKGYDWKKMKVTKTKEWKELAHSHGLTEQDKVVRALMETVEDDMGISFSQLLGPGFFHGGGDYDATGWRLEKGILDEIRKKYLEMKKLYPDNARFDNQALGIQLLAANKEDKPGIVGRMLRRTPSKFFQIVSVERDKIFAKYSIDPDRDWKPLQRALSLAEMTLWEDEALAVADIDLGREKDFREHVVPFLRRLGAPEVRFGDYHKMLHEFQDAIRRDRSKEHGGKLKYKTILQAIAEGKFPMTLSLSDFNWKDSNFFQLGAVAMDRRGRDNEAMAMSRDIMNDLLFKTEFLSPNDPLETLKKIKELRGTVNTYATGDVAEQVSKEVLRVFLEMNRNRAIHSKWLSDVMYLPGVETLMRNAAEWDFVNVKDSKLLKAVIPGWEKFATEKVGHWPHSIAEALSYSIRYTGAHGNAYDEGQIADILATAQDMGIFTSHPEYVQELRREFKATPEYRIFFRLLRKYWWVVIAATIALSAMKSIEDEEKRH